MEENLTNPPESTPAQDLENDRSAADGAPDDRPFAGNGEQPASAADSEQQPAPASDEGMGDVHAMIRELGALIAAAQPQEEPEPTEEEKQAQEKERKAALRKKRRRQRLLALRSMLLRLLLLAIVVYVLFFQVIGVTLMPGGDMYPRIDGGDLVLFYRLDRDVRAQDIVVFEKDAAALQQSVQDQDGQAEESDAQAAALSAEEAPKALSGPAQWWNELLLKMGLRRPEGKQMFICRVVAAAGDTVEITDGGVLLVNGNAMIETNIFSQTTPYVGFTEYPITLHAGECFVLADLRNGGADSRFFGPVLEEDILGTVITIVRRNNL